MKVILAHLDRHLDKVILLLLIASFLPVVFTSQHEFGKTVENLLIGALLRAMVGYRSARSGEPGAPSPNV
jgi:hypothetical protein